METDCFEFKILGKYKCIQIYLKDSNVVQIIYFILCAIFEECWETFVLLYFAWIVF